MLELLRWSIYTINSVDNTKLPCYTLPPTQHHSFFRNLPPFLMKEPGCRLPTPKGCLPTWLTYWWNLLKLHNCLIGSVPSLAAGLAFGGISALGAYQTSSNPRNVWVMLGKNILTLCNNKPFPSYLSSHFQSKSCCSSFHSHAN